MTSSSLGHVRPSYWEYKVRWVTRDGHAKSFRGNEAKIRKSALDLMAQGQREVTIERRKVSFSAWTEDPQQER